MSTQTAEHSPSPEGQVNLAASATPAPEEGSVHLPRFVSGVREFYLGMLYTDIPSLNVDHIRAVDTGWLTRTVLESQGQPLPEVPLVDLSPDELAAFNRFCECCEDDEGYDVSKGMMKKLSEIGLVRFTGFGRYTTTRYGDAVRAKLAGK